MEVGIVGLDVSRPCRSNLPLPLSRIGYIRTGVDDTKGLNDGPCEVDAF